MSIVNISHKEYLAHPAYGASDIVKMSRSMAYYKWRKENPEKPTRPLVVGSTTHLMLQAHLTNEMGLIDSGILTYVDGSSLTKGFKTFQADHPEHYCVDQEEKTLCTRMVETLLNDEEVMSYLKDATPEMTILANYPNTPIGCKVRPDYLHKGRGLSINVKTTTDASESGFLYAAKDYGYDWQSALYCSILTEEFGKSFDEIHILVEKTEDGEPCPINIFSFGDDTLGFARSQIHEIMTKISECEKSGKWPRNKPFLNQIDLPLHMRRAVSGE